MPADCVVLVGLPASGKTTFYAQRFAATHRHISKDLWPNVANKGARQAKELREALAKGQSVVVDNTNPTVADREAVTLIAREFGARLIGYYFTAGTREAVGRNRGRQGRERVPDVAIFTTSKRLIVPTYAEGFDELHRVAICADGSFEVSLLPRPG